MALWGFVLWKIEQSLYAFFEIEQQQKGSWRYFAGLENWLVLCKEGVEDNVQRQFAIFNSGKVFEIG